MNLPGNVDLIGSVGVSNQSFSQWFNNRVANTIGVATIRVLDTGSYCPLSIERIRLLFHDSDSQAATMKLGVHARQASSIGRYSGGACCTMLAAIHR